MTSLIVVAVLLPAIFVASAGLTGVLRLYALRRGVLDIPGSRSSHARPTPRGGGIAIAAAFTLSLLPLLMAGVVRSSTVLGFAVPGLLVAGTGFIDDHRHVRPRWRLLAHFAAAAIVLWTFGGFPSLPMVGFDLDLGQAGVAVGLLYVMWLINLTNFMDGIDGLAAVQVITACLGGGLAAIAVGASWATIGLPLVLCSACAGFLVWNWPPARIFMGDSGSGFVGLIVAALTIQAARTHPALFWSWSIMLAPFITDATIALLRRTARGERFYEAHRTHAYQHAALRYGSHRAVTLALAAINLGFLLPLALLSAVGILPGILACMFAYAPLIALAARFRSGLP